MLDRFGDFVSDQASIRTPPSSFFPSYASRVQVVAPVRETVSQTLASLLLHMSRRSVLRVHSILLQMIKQDFVIPTTSGKKNDMDVDRNHVWEVRHAGLLGVKYLVAVRSDLFEESIVKLEGDDVECGKEVLRGVADAAILGYGVDLGSPTLNLIRYLQVRRPR